MMPKPPKEFCVDSFIYEEYEGTNDWSEPQYAVPINIEFSRIDRGAQYTHSTSGKQLLYNSLIFCYKSITAPLPTFKEQSVVYFDGKRHVIEKVITVTEAYSNEIYSYELEVI